VERPRAADDFEVIRERLEELRREREEIGSSKTPGEGAVDSEADAETEHREQSENAPSAWVRTIFLPQPTD
jgi:hypothetical protein